MQHRTVLHRSWQRPSQVMQPVVRPRRRHISANFGSKEGGTASSSGTPDNHHYSSSNGTGASSNGASCSSYVEAESMTAILQDTQRHLLELNSRRIKVIEELAVAKERIKQLEQQVEQLQAEVRRPAPDAARQFAGAQHQGAATTTSHGPDASASTSGGSAATSAPAPAATVSITHYSSWPDVFIHYNADNKGWTTAPGVRMERAGGDQQAYVHVIQASSLEFVLTDGKDSWDKPSLLYGKSSNYLVGGPGKYVVRGGKLEQQS